MLGLRTEENDKFLKFFKHVQKEANRIGFTFFMETGDCKDIPFKNMEIDDICGWMIPMEKVSEFNEKYNRNEMLDEFDSFFTWCLPEIKNGKLIIKFQ